MASAGDQSGADVRPLHRSSSFEFLPPAFSELRVVLLGNSWTERRAVGNLILAENQLITEKEPDQCEKFSSEFEDKSVTIINTPDLLRTDLSEDDLSDQVESCVSLSDPGPHVFLLVLQPESFTEEQKWKLCRFLTRLSDRSFDHSMLLISTPREERDDDSPDLLLKEMVVKCQYRHLQLKNLKHPELLTRLGQIVKENNGYLSCAQNITEVDVRKEEVSTIFTPTTDKDGFRIVMFGKSEDKKKSLCNTILNKKNRFFKLNPSKHSEVACGEWREKPVKIVKVPDIFSLSVEALMEEMQSCVTLCLPGPNVLLLLVKPSDFTEKNRKTLQLVLNWFHQDPFKHTIVVLTHFEEMKPAVNKLLEECGGRHYNMFQDDYELLMQNIQDIVDRNRETFLTFSEDSSKSQPKEMKTHLNLVLFGPSEPLKTAAAKVILGHKDLPSECVRKQGEVFGRGVSLVELPALYGKAEQEVMEESFRCVSLCDPEGVHAFILVLPVGPLTDEDKGELHTIQDTFSSRVNDFTIILFTTETDAEHPAFVNFIKENKNIQDLLQICGGRYFVLNIRDRRQIKELMETVCGEKSSVFSTEMFTKVLIERILKVEAELQDVKQKSEDEQQSTKQLRKETEEVKKQEEELKKKHREETKSLQSQLEQQRKQQIQMLKEKVEIIENEREKRKKEREEEDKRWRKQEELQRKEWKQKLDASENRVKVEREQREAAERRLDQSRRDRTRDRDAWDKEKVGILDRMHQDLKQNLQETKQNLEEERERNRKLQEDFYLKRRKWTYLGFTLLLSVTLVLLYVYQSH